VTDRHAQIARLIDTRHDGLPETIRRTHTTAGFVHHIPHREDCPDCAANDRTMFGCASCGGRGYIEVWRDRDPYAVDKVQPFGLDAARHEHTRARDAQIARLADQTRPPWTSEADAIADADKHPEQWEIVRRRMYAQYDYQALDRALEQLAQTHPGISPHTPLAMMFIDARMPTPIRAPAEAKPALNGAKGRWVDPKARKARDTQIRTWAREGKPYQWIAHEVELSDRQIREIINRTSRAAA